MSQEETQDKGPMAGRAVEGAGSIAEGAVQQVESAVKEAALTASQSGLARIIGVAEAAHTLIDGGLEETINLAQSGRQNIVGDFGGDAIASLKRLRAKLDQAIEQLGAEDQG